ncbi:hypothetical protein Q9313_18675 (plasmid) [Shinella sumterensis]|uniref:Uncharacterized protein n=1 Tax=Shinella sumterensis TaxID=1967501 RepID=A0AA50CQ78_9HYPH|nr:hypothetical protein [Shinella sumterensis]WLS00101.1 hypothetical protein Q9313_18675 [Shinella sumterensis]
MQTWPGTEIGCFGDIADLDNGFYFRLSGKRFRYAGDRRQRRFVSDQKQLFAGRRSTAARTHEAGYLTRYRPVCEGNAWAGCRFVMQHEIDGKGGCPLINPPYRVNAAGKRVVPGRPGQAATCRLARPARHLSVWREKQPDMMVVRVQECRQPASPKDDASHSWRNRFRALDANLLEIGRNGVCCALTRPFDLRVRSKLEHVICNEGSYDGEFRCRRRGRLDGEARKRPPKAHMPIFAHNVSAISLALDMSMCFKMVQEDRQEEIGVRQLHIGRCLHGSRHAFSPCRTGNSR